jgi:transcriptional regulator with XRE-family HTH domain
MDKHGKEQKEIAEIVGVAPSTFNAWVKAKKYPRMDKVELLANYFGILKSDLIEERDGKYASRTISITEGEQKLLELFRLVPENKQELVLQMISVALKTQG